MLYKILKTADNCRIFVFLGLCLIHAKIYAQRDDAKQIFESISDSLSAKSSKDHQFGEFFLLLFAGAVLIFITWLAYQFYVQRKQSVSPDSAWALYKKLCQVHNLSLKERSVIRKVRRWNELEDPLPLFIEPNYFKQILADEKMIRFHLVVQELLKKLFSPEQEMSQELPEVNNDNSQENHQENLLGPEAVHQVEHQTGNLAAEMTSAHIEQSPALSGQEKPSLPITKVLLNPIPGRMAFSSLVEPLHRLTTEIAAESIRHNLSDGRGMNERTYDGIGELRQVVPEQQSLLFPKSHVPSPAEMLANESRQVDLSSSVSPTPQYLRTHKETAPVVSGKFQSDSRHNRNSTLPKPGEAITFENIAMLETMVTGK